MSRQNYASLDEHDAPSTLESPHISLPIRQQQQQSSYTDFAVDLDASDTNPLDHVVLHDEELELGAETLNDEEFDDSFPSGHLNATGLSSSSRASRSPPRQASRTESNPNPPVKAKPVQQTSQPWKTDFWRIYWDVDDELVKGRIMRALNPLDKPVLHDEDRNQYDLCGPFWTTTTLVIVLAILGNISWYLLQSNDNIATYTQDLKTLSIAAAVLFAFFTVVPTIMYFGLKRLNNTLGIIELMTVYGYSLIVFVPASCLAVINIDVIRWLSLLSAYAVSTWCVLQHVMSRTIDDTLLLKRWLFIFIVLVPHALLTLYIKLEHFPASL